MRTPGGRFVVQQRPVLPEIQLAPSCRRRHSTLIVSPLQAKITDRLHH